MHTCFLKMWRFVKGMKEPTVMKFKVDKPSTRSQAEYKNKTQAQTNFQITLKKLVRYITYSCMHMQALC